MKKFRFRLKKVLDHKMRLYEAARMKHAEAMRTLRMEEAKLESLRETYTTCLFELAEKTKKKFRVRDLGPYYRYMTFIKKEIANQSHSVYQAMEKEDASRKALMQAAKEKEILHKLQEKQYNAYKYVINKEEQKFIDDIAAAKYTREVQSR